MNDSAVRDIVHSGIRLQQAGKTAEAATAYRRALELHPDQPDALHWLGTVLFKQVERESGLALIRRSTAIAPTRIDFRQNLGAFAYRAGLHREAEAAFATVLTSDPNHLAALTSRSAVLTALGEPEAALEHADRALRVRPELSQAHLNRGLALRALSRDEEALPAYRQAIGLDPDFAEAHFNLAHVLLLLGQHHEGCSEYEWRWRATGKTPPHPGIPRWDGSAASGHRILICAEQGFGDTIHFFRHLTLARNRAAGAAIALECPPALHRLFAANMPTGVTLVSPATDSTPTDFCAPLMSLPHLLAAHDEPEAGAAYLQADAGLRHRWRTMMPASKKPRVGLVWAGNPNNPNDRNRSVPPEMFVPLLRRGAALFFNLQIDAHRAATLPLIEAGMIDLPAAPEDFADTAALIAELDLIITVDTATAHLAGALGKPVWTLLPSAPDWRWGPKDETTPLYASMRLFRRARGDTDRDAVIARVSTCLDEFSIRHKQAFATGAE